MRNFRVRNLILILATLSTEFVLRGEVDSAAWVLQGTHTRSTEEFFAIPPSHASLVLRKNWPELGIRDRYAHTVNPNVQKAFKDGRVDWSNLVVPLPAVTDVAGETGIKPEILEATQNYLENAARGYGDFRLSRPDVETGGIDTGQIYAADMALRGAVDDVGRLTGLPTEGLEEEWDQWSDGFVGELEMRFEAAVEKGKGLITSLIEALIGDLDKHLADWDKLVQGSEWLMENLHPPSAEARQELLASLDEALGALDELESAGEGLGEGLGSAGAAADNFRSGAGAIGTQTSYSSLISQLQSTQAVIAAVTSESEDSSGGADEGEMRRVHATDAQLREAYPDGFAYDVMVLGGTEWYIMYGVDINTAKWAIQTGKGFAAVEYERYNRILKRYRPYSGIKIGRKKIPGPF